MAKKKKGGTRRPRRKPDLEKAEAMTAPVQTESAAVQPPKQQGGCSGAGFMPGQSGNPGGRVTRFSTMISQAVRAQLGEIPDGENETNADLIVRDYLKAIRNEAKLGVISKAGVALLKEFGDRSEGKPRQTVELTRDLLSKLSDEDLDYIIQAGELPATVANA